MLIAASAFALAAIRPLADADLFWHLAFGRAVLLAKSRVVTESLTLPEFGGTAIVHEWLWDVLLATVRKAYGFRGISLLVVVASALAGGAMALLALFWGGERRRPFAALVAVALAAPAILTRVNERPETASLVFWPVGLLLASALARSSQRHALARAIPLVALTLLWAQVHLSVLAFVVVAIMILAPSAIAADAAARARLATCVALGLALFATAHGIHVFSARTLVGPAVAHHVGEWKPVTWAMANPFASDNAQAPPYLLMLGVGIVCQWKDRRRRGLELALAGAGVALVVLGRRGVTPAALLTVPLAAGAIDAATRGPALGARVARGLLAMAGAVGVVRIASWMDDNVSAFGTIGLNESAFPVGAAQLIAAVPGAHRVLSTYVSGPPISEGSGGRIRTFVDSRTPLLFHDADLAVAEDIWSGAADLGLVDARWQFDAAVVEREMPLCSLLAKDSKWTAVLVEPTFATFVRVERLAAGATPTPLAVLQPCGFHPIEEESCRRPELDEDLARLEPFVANAFLRVLRAERTIMCTKQFDGDAVLQSLPTRSEASGFVAQRDAVEAWLQALGGRGEVAVDLLEPHVARGDVWVLADVLPALQRRPTARVRRLLEGLDDTSAAARASFGVLANACAALNDVACARANAERAAVQGRVEELPALCWLARQPDARTRDDASRWLAALNERRPASSPALRCPP